MAHVFINYKTEDKAIVVSVKDYLTSCLISTWLDSEEIHGGAKLSSRIREGIDDSRHFLAFLSPLYVRSSWCMHELEEAEVRERRGDIVIIPVLLAAREDLALNELPREHERRVSSLLDRYLWIGYRHAEPARSLEEIAAAIANHQRIRFQPIRTKAIGGADIQLIQFQTDGDLPTDFLKSWSVDIERDFVAYNDGEEKPLRVRMPVGLNGKGPNWLYAYLTTAFKNLCPVYVFNNRSNEYICVYDVGTPPRHVGDVLR